MKKKKNVYYGVYGPLFKGVVHSGQAFKEQVSGKKGMYGKRFKTEQEALEWVENFISPAEKHQLRQSGDACVYAICGPDFTGIVHSKEEFVEKVFGKKGMRGKKCVNEQQAQKWMDSFTQRGKKKKKVKQIVDIRETVLFVEPTPKELKQQVILYIDGGYKNNRGTYGVVAYSAKSIEPIYRDFGYVYDERFNALKNTGAELMACLRGLEWAFANNMDQVCIIYDFEGIVSHCAKTQSNETLTLYQQMMGDFKKHLHIHFLHVRHANKTLHAEAHRLTQLVL
ncbi:hypothetical protein AAGS61_05050 [Lysinibacillus sp. KU-BSD001]|uniref:hypothetical protein n=1 Tax=Lysinibacillus sp. KU-BSD001 TaxID=3141328 RepID=UPI0036EA073F